MAPKQSVEPSASASPWLVRLAPLCVIAAGAAAYGNGFDGVFLFDDHGDIDQNVAIRTVELTFSEAVDAATLTPDLVIIQWWTTFWALAYTNLCTFCQRRRIPVAYILHNVLPHEQHPWENGVFTWQMLSCWQPAAIHAYGDAALHAGMKIPATGCIWP